MQTTAVDVPQLISSPCDWLLRLIGLGSLLLIAATWQLWLPQQAFPQVPLFSWARNVGALPHWLALAALLLGSVGLLVAPGPRANRWCCAALWLGYGGAILLNQHRLQPWAYQFLLLTLVLTWQAEPMALRLCRWFTVSIYAYSAWSKLDRSFLQPGGAGERMVGTLLHMVGFSDPPSLLLTVGSWLIVLGELAVALLLLVPATRRLGVGLAIVLHVGLLLILGPLGLNHSLGVLGWNAFFLVFIPLLFWPGEVGEQPEPRPGNIARKVVNGVMGFALLLPLAEPLGLCDAWLAWSLYSSRNEQAVLLLDPAAAESLPRQWSKYLLPLSHTEQLRFRMDWWSLEALGVPMYPENRFRVAVAGSVAEQSHAGDSIELLLWGPADRFTGSREQIQLVGDLEIEAQTSQYWFNAIANGVEVSNDQ